jgi:transposase
LTAPSFEEITNYFTGRQTSGFVEGLNTKLKVLKRRCYGITNLKHLYQRVFLDLNGYAQFGLASR